VFFGGEIPTTRLYLQIYHVGWPVHKVTILPLPPKDAFAWKVKQNKGKHQNKVPLLVQTAQNIFSATIKHSIFRHYCYIADLQNIEHCAGIKGMP